MTDERTKIIASYILDEAADRAMLISHLISMIVQNDETHVNERGNTVFRWHRSDVRYLVDFADDYKAGGWVQFDTDQDAWYFGVWLSPGSLRTLTYCEGDWSLVRCPDREHYNAEVVDAIEFYGEGFFAKTIDHLTGEMTTYVQDRNEFLIPEGYWHRGEVFDDGALGTADGVPYEWWLAGSSGAGFLLYVEGCAVEQVTRAKAMLRHRRDVVSLRTTRAPLCCEWPI